MVDVGGVGIINKILDIIYPPKCGICGKIGCKDICIKCEKELKNEAIFGKDSYIGNYFDTHFYLFKYEGQIRNLLIQYKFNEKAYLYKSFSKFLKKYEKKLFKNEVYDIIVAVPISKNRLKTRGYNQSELLAREIAKNFGLKSEKNIIKKVKNNIAQSTLSKEEREQNVKNVYEAINKDIIQNKKILLIDDIFTTGATVDECSKILKKNGAEKIDIFTIAKD